MKVFYPYLAETVKKDNTTNKRLLLLNQQSLLNLFYKHWFKIYLVNIENLT